MPESRVRRKSVFTPPPAKAGPPKPNPRWYAPLMVTLLIGGLAWVVVYYISESRYPIPDIGNWNLFAGFGVMLVGFMMTVRWR